MPIVNIVDKNGENHTTEVEMGTLLWNAADEAGVTIPHSCGLGCQCATCVVTVLEGHENLTHLDEEEIERAELEGINLADPANPQGGSDIARNICRSRFSCACQVNGDVSIALPD